MSLLYKLIIAASAIGLSQMLSSATVENTFAFAFIIVFGIPHGATDHVLHNLLKEGRINKIPQGGFLVYYLSVMVSYGLLWYFFPGWSLLIFLAVSAYHFGETQLMHAEVADWKKYISWTAWGSMSLLLIFQPHIGEVGSLVSPWLVSEKMMSWLIANYHALLIINSLILLISLISLGIKYLSTQIIELFILFCLSYFSSLLLSFSVFFAFWHSRDATMLQLEKIKNRVSGFDFRQWIILALPYTIASLIGMGMIVLAFNFSQIEFPLITLFFVLVALITLPHVFVMSRFYRC